MPWIIGIDEAGYGPNLGPLVMTAVACRVSEAHATADLWGVLRSIARRHSDPRDDRLVVADSKLVYAPGCGLDCLEQTVLAAMCDSRLANLADLVDKLAPECQADLRAEIWYDGTTVVPVSTGGVGNGSRSFEGICTDLEMQWGPVRSVIVCPPTFNAILDKWGSKGAVLASCLVQLLRAMPDDAEPTAVFIDKHGGRNQYAALLQPAFDDGMVLAHEEGSQRSVYRVQAGRRQVVITIEPRADANHFCVAVASMVSKYVREMLMIEFNRFWKARLPRLKPTAGYPLDAKRFWAEIKETASQLGLKDDTLWRRK